MCKDGRPRQNAINMFITHQVQQLFTRQVTTWPLAATNYAALSHVKTKKLSINGFDFIVQFNPTRITSSAAQIDSQTIRERPCFLCSHHLPVEQEKLPYTTESGNNYLILCNPYPIFPQHLTIVDLCHTPQLITGRIEDMLELADQLPDFVLFYNGPQSGASAPDHFHFQAGNKGFLPLQREVERGARFDRYPAPFSLFTSDDPMSVSNSFSLFFNDLQEEASCQPEPKINLLCWKKETTYHLVLFPRKLHRPAQFFAQGDARILLSPGSVDLAGVLITPLEKDFIKMNEADVLDIFAQVSLPLSLFRHGRI